MSDRNECTMQLVSFKTFWITISQNKCQLCKERKKKVKVICEVL
jgi:hypothetical protein